MGLPAGSQQVGRVGAERLRVIPGTAVEAPSEGTGPAVGQTDGEAVLQRH